MGSSGSKGKKIKQTSNEIDSTETKALTKPTHESETTQQNIQQSQNTEHSTTVSEKYRETEEERITETERQKLNESERADEFTFWGTEEL